MLRLNPDKRINGNIEFLRFFFAYYIAIEHFCMKIPGGLPSVDFFFLIAGYYQMQKMTSRTDFSPFRYILQRFIGMMFLYESSIILMNLVGDEGFSLRQFVGGLYRSIPDMFCLQMSGFYEIHVNSPLWYISAMMIAGFLLALLYSYNSRLFTHALPVIALLCYAGLFYYQGDMDATYFPNITYPTPHLIPLGTVRAIGGLSLGCMLFQFSAAFSDKLKDRKYRLFFSCAEVASYLIMLYGVFFNHHNHFDFYYLILLPVALVSALSQNTYWGSFFNRIGQFLVSLFGKQYTLAVFCFQIFAIRIYTLLFGASLHLGAAILVYSVILTVISILFTKLSDRFNARFLRRG